MDREKVIKEYEDYVNSYISLTTSHDYEFEMHKAVLALLKEQEAKNVAWSLGRAYCPTCGELFPKKKDVQYIRFCSYCGQSVKWNDL